MHSMGGLVSRWFIEQLGGDRVVDHLVMCGTPNHGSPFGKVGPTLEQMSPTSEFMAKLNASGGPPIPYSVLAGDIDAFEDDSESLFGKLLAKAGKGVTFEALFGTEHHDIAVRVDSVRGVAASSLTDVACHHLNYFTSQPGLAALAQVAWKGLP